MLHSVDSSPIAPQYKDYNTDMYTVAGQLVDRAVTRSSLKRKI